VSTPARFPGYDVESGLLLRPPAPADAERIQALANDPELAANLSRMPHPYDIAMAHGWIADAQAKRAAGEQHAYVIERLADRIVVGTITLRPQATVKGHFGYWVGREFWGQGIATGATRSAINLLFTHGDSAELWARHLAANAASGRVMEKNGMRVLRSERAPHRGGEALFVLRGITRGEWERRNAPIGHVPFAPYTQRIAFEALTPAHAQPLLAGMADPSLYRWIDRTPPDLATLADRFRRISHPYAKNGDLWLNWALRSPATGEYLGVAEATVHPDRVAEIAYFIFSPHQRRGYAVEAMTAAIAHLVRDYRVHRLVIETDTRNLASQRVAEKLGFTREGGARAAGELHGVAAFDYRFTRDTSPPSA